MSRGNLFHYWMMRFMCICDVCKSLHRIEDVSYAAFGSCSFEQLNACEKCSEELQKEDEKKQIAEALGWYPKVTLISF